MKCLALISTCLLMTLAGCRFEDRFIEPVELKNASGVEREVLNAEKNPALLAIGKLKMIGNTECSLILVSENVALTAGHCILTANIKFDAPDYNPALAAAIFKTRDGRRIEDVNIEKVLRASDNPDYAIIRLTKKISADQIAPLKMSNLTLDEIIAREKRLGCAGYNGDKLGDGGMLMTISRSIKILKETSGGEVIDTNCISHYGGSGGLFFEELPTGETNLLGVVYAMRDEKYNERGELVRDENISTQITPVSAFYGELTKIIKAN